MSWATGNYTVTMVIIYYKSLNNSPLPVATGTMICFALPYRQTGDILFTPIYIYTLDLTPHLHTNIVEHHVISVFTC